MFPKPVPVFCALHAPSSVLRNELKVYDTGTRAFCFVVARGSVVTAVGRHRNNMNKN